jgi:hypothetical protein
MLPVSNLAGKCPLFYSFYLLQYSHPWVNYGVRSPKFIWALVYNTPPPHLASYTRAQLDSQDRRHLCVTPCSSPSYRLSRIGISTLRAYCPTPPPCASAGAEIFRERAFLAVSSLPTLLPLMLHSSEIKVLSISILKAWPFVLVDFFYTVQCLRIYTEQCAKTGTFPFGE